MGIYFLTTPTILTGVPTEATFLEEAIVDSVVGFDEDLSNETPSKKIQQLKPRSGLHRAKSAKASSNAAVRKVSEAPEQRLGRAGLLSQNGVNSPNHSKKFYTLQSGKAREFINHK